MKCDAHVRDTVFDVIYVVVYVNDETRAQALSTAVRKLRQKDHIPLNANRRTKATNTVYLIGLAFGLVGILNLGNLHKAVGVDLPEPNELFNDIGNITTAMQLNESYDPQPTDDMVVYAASRRIYWSCVVLQAMFCMADCARPVWQIHDEPIHERDLEILGSNLFEFVSKWMIHSLR